MDREMKSTVLMFLTWLISLFAVFGSLFFSEVMRFPPCILCWYQRIAMYPLCLIILIGLVSGEKSTLKFSAPLAFIGWFISLYHNLLIFKILPKSAAPCISGVPCTTVYVNYFGFLNIPMMSFISFTIVLVLTYFIYRVQNEK